MNPYDYSAEFFDYIQEGSISSAEAVIPVICSLLSVKSVLDVGCGRGAWLKVWHENNVEIFGVDKVKSINNLLVPADKFTSIDISDKFDLGAKFDLVQCLEVAEHLPKSSAGHFIESLTAHGDMVLFSAAPPGQGGEHHINEQPYEFWQKIFYKYGFDLYDIIRPAIKDLPDVKPYYKYNIFLFVRCSRDKERSLLVNNKKVFPIQNPPDISPIPYKLRKCLIRLLPILIVTQLSILNRIIKKHLASS